MRLGGEGMKWPYNSTEYVVYCLGMAARDYVKEHPEAESDPVIKFIEYLSMQFKMYTQFGIRGDASFRVHVRTKPGDFGLWPGDGFIFTPDGIKYADGVKLADGTFDELYQMERDYYVDQIGRILNKISEQGAKE